jgi:4-hydroxybenzoate polyprenyltransferase
MLSRLRLLLGMIRFSHTIFALPFALSSAVLAWKTKAEGFSWRDLLGIVLCMVFARSVAMAVNRLADQHLDAANPRTAGRHLPMKQLTPSAVAFFAIVCAAGFFASTLLFWPNPWPLYLSVPVLAFVCAYSYTKRFTSLVHFWLGASLLLAPVGAWIAIRGFEQIEIALVLGLAVLFWVAGFDILYACQDVEFDRKAGLFSVPARVGVSLSLKAALICHLLMIAMLVLLWWIAGGVLGWVYLAGVTAVALLLLYEHWLVRPDDLSRVNQAFFQVNGIISIGLFLVVLVQVLV